MREIGSEFWDVPIKDKLNNVFPDSTQWFLSGRSALQAVVKHLKGCCTVAMPSWCCDSMVKPFLDAGMKVLFYPVYWRDVLVQEIRQDCDVLFLIDYFGYTSDLPDLSCYKGFVIRDVTHSIFSATYSDAHFCFGSLRKWCGVWTGGYAWSNDGSTFDIEYENDFDYTVLRARAMEMKSSYISKNGVKDKEFLQLFKDAEDRLENVGISNAANRDIKLARLLDVDYIKEKRRANAELLLEAFPKWLVFKNLSLDDCPMFVPIIVPNGKRNQLRNYLINNNIYCPIHWPVSNYHALDDKELFIYDNSLSLVCDQRYSKEDMIRMIATISNYLED